MQQQLALMLRLRLRDEGLPLPADAIATILASAVILFVRASLGERHSPSPFQVDNLPKQQIQSSAVPIAARFGCYDENVGAPVQPGATRITP